MDVETIDSKRLMLALESIDPRNPEAWNSDGKVSMAAVEAAYGGTDVNRKHVVELWPEFSHATALEAWDEKRKQKEWAAGVAGMTSGEDTVIMPESGNAAFVEDADEEQERHAVALGMAESDGAEQAHLNSLDGGEDMGVPDPAPMGPDGHWSDCATHNDPPEDCDCKGEDMQAKPIEPLPTTSLEGAIGLLEGAALEGLRHLRNRGELPPHNLDEIEHLCNTIVPQTVDDQTLLDDIRGMVFMQKQPEQPSSVTTILETTPWQTTVDAKAGPFSAAYLEGMLDPSDPVGRFAVSAEQRIYKLEKHLGLTT